MSRVLVIDDSQTTVKFVATALRTLGHETDTLSSFLELPRRLKTSPPDLIILDLNIPVLSGIPFGHLIRKYQDRPIPLVIYSSRPDSELERAARELGAVGFLRKGPDPGPLQRTVAEVLEGSLARAT